MCRGVTVGEALVQGTRALSGAVESPRLEARLLLAHMLGTKPEVIIGDPGRVVDAAPFEVLVARRVAGEPLAYLLEYREFWSLRFAVSPATLIPRPDSETLIEAAMAALPDRARVRRILDLGTGTGCLLLAALTEFPEAFGVGVDRVEAAARLGRDNARGLGLDQRAAFVCGDWDASIGEQFDLLLSNPPYIASDEIAGLMPEVARYEPRDALDGGADGLAAYRLLVPALRARLAPEGVAVLEIGAGQDSAVVALAKAWGFTTSVRADLAGTPRAVVLRNDPP